ncbi:MAG: GAF domain-containing protein [Chloroflexi bacterium]|nr:GAF domain-containing protein [Chloroflexota bacterium]
MNKRAFFPLRWKLAVSFALLAVLTVGAVSYFAYQNTREQLNLDIRARLRDAVSIAALQVDGDLHATISQPEQETTPEYLRLKTSLQNIRDAGTNFRYVYTMRQDENGNVVFIGDAEEDPTLVSHPGDIYDDASDFLKANIATINEAVVEDEMYTDKWGTWLTGYAPIYRSDGTREGILGMDISAANVIAQERRALYRYLVIFGLSAVPIAIVGFLLGMTLASPIAKLTASAAKFAAGDLNHSVDIRTNDEFAILGAAFNATVSQLHSLVTGLERRVEERTVALTRRTSQLQASVRVARAAAAIKEPATLLNEVVRLISEQFNVYHAGIFLLDDNSEYAILQAASSEGGERMLERGHRLQVGGQGIVGFSAAQKRPRIALDTGVDAVYFDNPDLPHTRSEAALPLIARDRVIGVLDIQSEKPQAFTPDDIEIFQTLADQIALAIENARLLNQMELTLSQMARADTMRVNETWGNLARAKALAYQYTALGIQSIPQLDPKEALDGKIKIPIPLHNQKIGEIRLKQKDESDRWTDREKNMLAEIAAQVGLALENARLLSDAQQRAARERAIGEIAAHIDSAHDVDAILRITAQEIGKAIGDSEVIVQIREQEVS